MTVTLLSLSARGEGEISVAFELREGGSPQSPQNTEHIQKESFLVSAAMIADLRLSVGESTQECFDTVSHCAQVYYAVKRGLILLGYGSCSCRALVRKLSLKGIEREIAEEAVAELIRSGYLNDAENAFREGERCISKCWGKRRIAAELYSKGYGGQAVRGALERLEDEGVDYVELCAKRIRMRTSVIPQDREERRRLIASMERYGFSSSEIREATRLLSKSD